MFPRPSRSYPELWYALNLALLWPGLGHCYAGQRRRGLVWAIGMALLLAIVLWSLLGPNGSLSLGAAALGVGGLLWVVNVFDACACYRPYRAGLVLPSIAKDAWYGVLLSQCLPGLGHLDRQQHISGAAWLTASGLLWLLSTRWPLLGLPAACLAVIPCYQLSSGAQRRRFAAVLLICRLTIGGLPTAITAMVEPFVVPSESMRPTLDVGDRILVFKLQRDRVHIGDLIVFNSPKQRGQYFVKRVVGLPGDVLAVQSGQLLRNGQLIAEPYLTEPIAYDLDPQVIPPDRLFVLGDNRNRSYDSHVWGSLDRRQLIGRVYRISWPLERSRSF